MAKCLRKHFFPCNSNLRLDAPPTPALGSTFRANCKLRLQTITNLTLAGQLNIVLAHSNPNIYTRSWALLDLALAHSNPHIYVPTKHTVDN